MAQAAVELDAAVLDHVENMVFSYERGAGGFGGFSSGAVFWCDHTDAQVGFDGVGHADAIADHGAVFGRLEADVEFVFDGGGVTAYFDGAQVAREISCQMFCGCREACAGFLTYRMASTKLNCSASRRSGVA